MASPVVSACVAVYIIYVPNENATTDNTKNITPAINNDFLIVFVLLRILIIYTDIIISESDYVNTFSKKFRLTILFDNDIILILKTGGRFIKWTDLY